MLDDKEARFKAGPRPRPFPGVQELLNGLKRRGKRLALVTGTAADEVRTVLPEDLKALFEVMTTGDQVVHGKPDPEPYLKTLRSLRLTPEQAVVVENAPLGLLSARAAGIPCLVVETSTQCSELAGADGCFPDIKALSEFFLP